jgi:hypothetical protein
LPWLLDFRDWLEPDLLKADLDRLSHPTLSRIVRRSFLPEARGFGAPASTLARVLGIEGAPEPLQFKDQGCALWSPFLRPRPAVQARRVEMLGVF